MFPLVQWRPVLDECRVANYSDLFLRLAIAPADTRFSSPPFRKLPILPLTAALCRRSLDRATEGCNSTKLSPFVSGLLGWWHRLGRQDHDLNNSRLGVFRGTEMYWAGWRVQNPSNELSIIEVLVGLTGCRNKYSTCNRLGCTNVKGFDPLAD